MPGRYFRLPDLQQQQADMNVHVIKPSILVDNDEASLS
jgi:hypothetical protein